MVTVWNKGHTKHSHPSVAKMAKTFGEKKIDNFQSWRQQQLKNRPRQYHRLAKNGNLAELIGAVLGDGYLGQHDRTQVLKIVSNSNNPGFIERYANLVEVVFAKTPRVSFRKTNQCADIVIYQNNLAERLGLLTGCKTHREFILPDWIASSKIYKLRFLRGLYETDGCLAHHPATYTHKFTFSNVNESLLNIVFMLLCEFGFHPTKTKKNIQLSRKAEVATAAKLLKFRQYK